MIDRDEIIKLRDSGLTIQQIADKYNRNKSTISRLITNGDSKQKERMALIKAVTETTSIKKLSAEIGVPPRKLYKIKSGQLYEHEQELLQKVVLEQEKQEKLITELVCSFRNGPYPFVKYSESILIDDFQKLKISEQTSGTIIISKKEGLKIVNNYQPQIDKIASGNKLSVYNAFFDPGLLKKALEQCIKKKRECTPENARKRLLANCAGYRASNFPPNCALNIYTRYKPSSILDFSHGWGGRLLGAAALNINYTGIDPSPFANEGINNIINFLTKNSLTQSNFTIIKGCAEGILTTLNKSYDMVFTSPPYFDKEKYDSSSDQSTVKYPLIDDWYENFLKKCMIESFRILNSGGYLVLNIDNEMLVRVLQISKEIGFTIETPLRMAVNKNAFNKKIKTKFKEQPILVMQKI